MNTNRTAFLFIFIIILTSCTGGDKSMVTVASKIDTEGALLGNMIILSLENAGIKTLDKTEFGQTDVIRKAIKNDEIDIYPEYTGNGAFFFNKGTAETWKDPKAGYELVKNIDMKNNNIVWLTPAPANNTWAIAVQKDIAQEYRLETLEDMAEYVNNGNTVKLACSEEFASREDVLPAFEKTYGFSLRRDQLLILSGGNTATTEKAAARGTDGVNFCMAYGTDGQLSALGLKVLKDTKKVQPVYQPAPIVRQETLKRFPKIKEVLNPIFASLSLEDLQKLNSQIAVEGKAARTVAKEYLNTNGFISKQ
jgi:osmoprotectant transport system substrate-binding protein